MHFQLRIFSSYEGFIWTKLRHKLRKICMRFSHLRGTLSSVIQFDAIKVITGISPQSPYKSNSRILEAFLLGIQLQTKILCDYAVWTPGNYKALPSRPLSGKLPSSYQACCIARALKFIGGNDSQEVRLLWASQCSYTYCKRCYQEV